LMLQAESTRSSLLELCTATSRLKVCADLGMHAMA
jgi:hypothetical protein